MRRDTVTSKHLYQKEFVFSSIRSDWMVNCQFRPLHTSVGTIPKFFPIPGKCWLMIPIPSTILIPVKLLFWTLPLYNQKFSCSKKIWYSAKVEIHLREFRKRFDFFRKISFIEDKSQNKYFDHELNMHHEINNNQFQDLFYILKNIKKKGRHTQMLPL